MDGTRPLPACTLLPMETGSLEVEAPAELLRRLAQEGATGCLHLTQGEGGAAELWFRVGSVYTASAPSARARLGDRLVGAGHISEQQLRDTLDRQRQLPERRRIGELLTESGLIDRDTMRTYVQEQIADSVAVALSWTDGTFSFAEGEEIGEDIPLDVSVENLLMEGARRLEEWNIIQRRLGSLDAVVDFVPSGGTAELSLTPDEWSMLTRIDGTSSVRDIAEESGYGEFEAARIIYGLLTTGVVSLLGRDDEEPGPHSQVDDLTELLTDADAGPSTPADDAAPPPPDPTDELLDAREGDREEDEAKRVDRNSLLREFAALDDDWGTSVPPLPAPGSEPEAPAEPPPPPPRPSRPAPPPEREKPKRGLFGRRKKD